MTPIPPCCTLTYSLFSDTTLYRSEFAEQCEVDTLPRKVARTDQPRAAAGQLREVTDAADRLHRLVGLEIGFERHRGRDAVALDQRHRLLDDAAVQRIE